MSEPEGGAPKPPAGTAPKAPEAAEETQPAGSAPAPEAAPAADRPRDDGAPAAVESTAAGAAAGTQAAGEAAGRAQAAAEAAAKAKAAAEAAARAKAAKEAAEASLPPWERLPHDPRWRDAADDPLAQALRERHGEAIESARVYSGDEILTLQVRRDAIRGVCESLKREHGYTLFVDLCGAHHPARAEAPFEVVYHCHSFEANRRARLKVATDEATPVPSVTPVWRGANWPEREAYDMFGIRFADHPDMTRILLWEGFNGHPLRKDFPVEGIDTGSAIYPEYYTEEAGPVIGTGTGWKPKKPENEGGAEEAGK